MGKTAFTSNYLLRQLGRQPDAVPCFHVAYSGGLDSHVLLHALGAVRDQLDARIAAVHVHHGLQAEADQWETHCREVCAALDIDFRVLAVDARGQQLAQVFTNSQGEAAFTLMDAAVARIVVPFVPGWSERVRVGENNDGIVLGLPAVRLPVFFPVQAPAEAM